MNVSDFIIERLAEWGVKRIYGYPGDGINGGNRIFPNDLQGEDAVEIPLFKGDPARSKMIIQTMKSKISQYT